MSSEMRQNKLTGQWVIYAPDRSDRPKDFKHNQPGRKHKRPPHDEDCPFCPGNSDMLPRIILEQAADNDAGWQTRVVPNKYPMLEADLKQRREQQGIYVGMPGYGHHEVIIEHPRHDLDLAQMTDDEVATVIETYHRRYNDLMHDNNNMLVIIFRNHGPRAGTSIIHPHSQLVVTGVVPQHVRWREDIAQRYYDTWGRSLMGDIIAHELAAQTRLVEQNDAFLAFVPYAAEVPFEIWVVPRRQQADFGSINVAEKHDLARILRRCLQRLHGLLDDPDYNYVIHSAARYKAGEPHLYWYIQIRPRLVTPAGFEIGSGMLVNPSLPEDDATALRKNGYKHIS